MTSHWRQLAALVLIVGAAPVAANAEPTPGGASGIVQTGRFRYTVDVDELAASVPDGWSPRLLVHRGVDGEIDGYRLADVRGGSLTERLGFRNGDIIETRESRPLHEVVIEAVRVAWSGRPSAPPVCVNVSRRQQSLELCYDLTHGTAATPALGAD